MRCELGWVHALACVLFLSCSAKAHSQALETEIVISAEQVLREITTVPEKGIPRKLLADSKAVAIFPGVIKAGFVIGGRHGRGVLCLRHESGEWSNPLFLSITGGSVGFQAGAQSTDLVLVFRTNRGIDAFLKGKGKLALGGDVSIAAGPIGRETGLATDGKLAAEIFSYSRSRGLFAGASLGGSKIKTDEVANELYYATESLTAEAILTQTDIPVRESAEKLKRYLQEVAPAPTPPVLQEGLEHGSK